MDAEMHREEKAPEISPLSTTDKVGSLIDTTTTKKEKSNRDFSLCMVLPGECYEFKKDISKIYLKMNSTISPVFQHSSVNVLKIVLLKQFIEMNQQLET